MSQGFDQMIQENAKRLLEDMRKQKGREQKQKENLTKKKHKIIEDDQKIRELNKQFYQPGRQKRSNYAWGIDQRKFQNSSGRGFYDMNLESSRSEEKKQRFGRDESYSNDAQKRSHPKPLQQGTRTSEDSFSGKPINLKRLISPEQENKIRLLMGQKVADKETIQKEKQKIKENLMRTQESVKTQAKTKQPSENERIQDQNVRKNQAKGGKMKHPGKTPTAGDKSANKKSNLNDYSPIKKSDQSSMIHASVSPKEDEEDQNFSSLYHQFRNIVDDKQYQTLQQQESSRISRDASYSQHSARQNPFNSNANSTGAKVYSERISALEEYSDVQQQIADEIGGILPSNQKSYEEDSRVHREQGTDIKRSQQDLSDFNEAESQLKSSMKEEQKGFVEATPTSNVNLERHNRDVSTEKNERVSEKSPMNQEFEGELYDETYFEDEEAYRQNFAIIEAAVIFIQKNYRGYLTRRLLAEYLEHVRQQQKQEQRGRMAQTMGNFYGDGKKRDNSEDLRETGQYYSVERRPERRSKSLDEDMYLGNRSTRAQERYHQAALAEENDDEISQEEYLKESKLDNEREQETEDYDQYQFLNQQLRSEMLMNNAAQYDDEKKKKRMFKEDMPQIASDNNLDVSIEEEEVVEGDRDDRGQNDAKESPYNILKEGQTNLMQFISNQKMSMSELDYDQPEKDQEDNSEEIISNQESKGQRSEGIIRYDDNDTANQAFEEQKDHRRQNQQQAVDSKLPGRYQESDSPRKSAESEDKFASSEGAGQEKVIFVSTINSEDEGIANQGNQLEEEDNSDKKSRDADTKAEALAEEAPTSNSLQQPFDRAASLSSATKETNNEAVSKNFAFAFNTGENTEIERESNRYYTPICN